MVWGLTPYLDLFLFKRRVKARKENLRPSDLASISPFNRKSCNSKPDYLLARSIKNVTYLYTPAGKNKAKQSRRASDLALNSPFNGRSSKPDYLLARSIKNVTSLYDPGRKNRLFLLCPFYLR